MQWMWNKRFEGKKDGRKAVPTLFHNGGVGIGCNLFGKSFSIMASLDALITCLFTPTAPWRIAPRLLFPCLPALPTFV